MTVPPDLVALAAAFDAPRREARPWAFWFLNDSLDDADLVAQLEEFADAGFGAVCPCARVGLSEDAGYLSPAWFRAVRLVVETCERLGLGVVLYDEASYPSGAANGLVVAQSPEFAARCLVAATARVRADERPVYARPHDGRSLWVRRVATVVVPVAEGVPDYGRSHLATPDAAGLVRVEAGTGEALVVALLDVPSGGTIRGAHAWQDDGSALAPAAADLMNPDAVAAFIALTHERYAAELGDHLGRTVTAWFTDEPDVVGRGARPDGIAWTPGFEAGLAAASGWDDSEVRRRLPELFDPAAPGHAAMRRLHADAVRDRLATVYYGAQRAWCDAHGLALTGHPHEPDELRSLAVFTWPGQDAVWRWVLPGQTALSGAESVSARAASGAAAQVGAPVAVTEVFGAYGWGLTMDEAKWLVDWHAVRGTTAFCLHALFSSVRGGRAFESEPDVGRHNAWWHELPTLLTYLGRLAEVGRSADEEVDVLVVCAGDRAPSDEVAPLYRAGVGFHYAPIELVEPAHRVEADERTADAAGRVRVGVRTYGTCVVVEDGVAEALDALGAARVLVADDGPWWTPLVPTDWFRVVDGRRDDLRIRRMAVGDVRGALLVNEGEGEIVLTVEPDAELWDPWTGVRTAAPERLALGRRGSALLWERPTAAEPTGVWPPPGASGVGVAVSSWTPPPGDWALEVATETFAGTVSYTGTFDLDEPADLRLDLGAVGDLATVLVNGVDVAALYWAPYRCAIAAVATRAGENLIEVRVTNSSANRWEGALRPSGLLGPVTLTTLAPH